MLMIRFQRIGRKNDPAFRIAVVPKAAGPKAGKFVDLVGTYNPKTKATTLKADAIKDWMSKGAQVSPSLHNLLVKEGVIVAPKTAKVVSKANLEKNIAKKAAEEAKAKEAAEAAALKAEADAKAAAEAEAAASEEAAPAEEVAAPEAPVEVPAAPEEAPVAIPEEAPTPEVTAAEEAA